MTRKTLLKFSLKFTIFRELVKKAKSQLACQFKISIKMYLIMKNK